MTVLPILGPPNIEHFNPHRRWAELVGELADVPAPAGGGPRISVVTPTLNRMREVCEAIESVAAQDHAPLEHLVVDGGSSDGTCEAVLRYGRVRLLPGPDRDSHDGMSRGASAAAGEVLSFLASDDVYLPGALARAAAAFRDHPDAVAVIGPALLFRRLPDGGRTVSGIIRHAANPALLVEEVLFGTPAINAWFLRKDAFARFGPFRSDIPIAADRYFLLRLCLEGGRIVVLDRPLYAYCQHAGSATLDPEGRRGAQILRDHIALAHELLGPRPLPGLPRSTVHAWLALESVHLELIRGSAATIGRALPALARLFAADRLWPIHFLDAARRRRRLRRLSMTGG